MYTYKNIITLFSLRSWNWLQVWLGSHKTNIFLTLSFIFLRESVVLAFPVLSNWVGLGSLLDSLDYLDLTGLGLGEGETSGGADEKTSSDEDNFCSDLDLEELTNEVDGLETLAKEMEVNTNRLF